MVNQQYFYQYVHNCEQRLYHLKEEVSKLSFQERYKEAKELQIRVSELDMTTFRLKRLLKGEKAFEVTKNCINSSI